MATATSTEQARGPAPTISIIIPAYGAPEALRETLDTIWRFTRDGAFEVIVVDSGADHAPVRKAVEDFSVTYTPVQNRGFAAACNAGIQQARAGLIALLNPDVLLRDDVFGKLAALLQHDPRIACAGPRLLRPDGSPQPYAFGWEPSPRFLIRRGLRRLLGKPEETISLAPASFSPTGTSSHQRHHSVVALPPTTAAPFDVDWVAGTCLVARREAFATLGLLDERFFLYWEDVDWCLRAKRRGWRVVFAPDVAVTHIGGASTGSSAPAHYYRSLVRFYRKWYGAPAALVLAGLLRLYAPVVAAMRRIHAYRH